MTGKQEICNPLLDLILVSTVPTYQLPFLDFRLEQQGMQISEGLVVCSSVCSVWIGGGIGGRGWGGSSRRCCWLLVRNRET